MLSDFFFGGVVPLFQDGTVEMVASVEGLLDKMDGCEPNDRLLLKVNDTGLVVDVMTLLVEVGTAI